MGLAKRERAHSSRWTVVGLSMFWMGHSFASIGVDWRLTRISHLKGLYNGTGNAKYVV